jgi:glycosyltransferase involved in cell wall biosynthesis
MKVQMETHRRSKLTIVIPCFNEEGSLPALVERCKQVSSHQSVDFIFVDNGSVDSTPILLPQLLVNTSGLRIVSVAKNQGYGGGILAGLADAKTDFVGWTHADLQSDPFDVIHALLLLESTLVSENVFIKGRRKNRALMSVFFTSGMSVFETVLFRMQLYDINAQPTIIRRDFLEELQSAPTDFSFDLHAYVTAKKQGLSVKRFEVRFKAREFGESKWNTTWRSRLNFITLIFNSSVELAKRYK